MMWLIGGILAVVALVLYCAVVAGARADEAAAEEALRINSFKTAHARKALRTNPLHGQWRA